MRVVVVGAGAMGSLYGGQLKESGQDVVLVDIWAQHVETINNVGLRIEKDQAVRLIPVPACFASEITEKPDLIILFTKTFHSEEAIKSILQAVKDETLVLTLQNGLGNVELLQQYFAADKVILGSTNFPSDLVGPGHIKTHGAGETRIMALGSCDAQRLETIRIALDRAGFQCSIVKDIFPLIWEKVAFNAAMNSLTSITKLTVGRLGSTAEGRDLAYQVAGEVLSVAEKKGLVVNRERVRNMLDDAFVDHYEHMPSMLQDMLAGKKTEIEAINGAVLREAAAAGVAVPATEVLYKIIKLLEETQQRGWCAS
jgi:2-dehydropantoate 2-reductase